MELMSLDIVPACDLPFDAQAEIFNRAFAGYLAGWSDIDASGLTKIVYTQGIDLCYSRFVRSNGEFVGFGYISRTGNFSRLTGMGVVAHARRSGAAGFLISHLLEEAKSRGDGAMALEVFEQNPPALALYRRHGFRELMRLFGWRRRPHTIDISTVGELEEISLLTAAQIRGSLDFPDIPWQISRYAVAKLPEARAYKIENACVIVSNPNVTPTRVYALLNASADSGAALRNVLAAVLKRFSANEFFAREVFPDQFGAEIFEPLGFARGPFNQILMRHDF